jgi:hypothetical protein
MRARIAPPGTLATAILLVALLLAGCLEPTGSDQESEQEEIFFEPGLGPGHASSLIQLSGEAAADAREILAACTGAEDRIDCLNIHLKSVLDQAGSVYAFDVLEAMALEDTEVRRLDHAMAHVLGRHALYVYGTIGETLITCSHKVFQGCIHGSLQEYFEHVDLDTTDLDAVCPDHMSRFEAYACNHGLGHGLVLATGYDLPRSLFLCETLATGLDQTNCYGGAFMENVVAHNDHIRAGGTFAGHGRDPQTWSNTSDEGDPHAHHGLDHGSHHAHGGDTLPDFWVDPEDLQFPCNAIAEQFQAPCWRMQTSLILLLNGGDFREAAGICASLEDDQRDSCWESLGRDASSWGHRDPATVFSYCAHAEDPAQRYICIRAAVGEIVTNYADPYAALAFCEGYPGNDQAKCYKALGSAALNHLDTAGLEDLCEQAMNGFQADCREGAGL